jgi:uncharacterized SAM-binding protein YcdF (DUF218 family)
MSILIVLFGQENEADGKLRIPAATRCAKAAEVWKALSPGSEVVVLPTGSFGQHFNLTPHPHFYYLTQELMRLGVPPENILPGVASSNTVQDCTEAWYRFKNGGHHKLVAVTSDYHAARVGFVLGRLSVNDDAEIEVVTADTPSTYQGTDKELEEKKLARLKREWVDVIPRTSKTAPERFVAVYENAGREYRRHNTLSTIAVAGIVAINGFAFLIVPGNAGWTLFFMLLALAIIDLLLWSLYERLADTARMARLVLTRMEIEHRMPGFSMNRVPRYAEWYRSPPWLWSMKELVTALTVALFVAVAILSLSAPSENREETPRNRVASPVANSIPSPTPVNSTNGNAVDRFANAVLGSANNSNINANTRRRR